MRTGFAAIGFRLGAAVALLAAGPAGGAPNAKALGKRIYDRDCAACHQIGPGAMSLSGGPALNGIIGMPAGDEPDFAYSDATKKSAIIWSADTFKAFIANPATVIPGNKMVYGGLRSRSDREALLAYVKRFGPSGGTR